MLDLIEKIKKLSIKNGCWLFNGYLDKDGYGIVSGIRRVHRISAHIYLNYDLEDKEHQVLHKLECKNKNCWNPEHLYIGTALDNALDRQQTKSQTGAWGTSAMNSLKTHCSKGHEFNEKNTNYWTNPKTGRIARICKVCNALNAARKRSIYE